MVHHCNETFGIILSWNKLLIDKMFLIWQHTPLMTPMMTPSYHTGPGLTPAQPMATPIIATPQQPMATPSQQPIATPQYVTTPRSNWNQSGPGPGATPGGRTPGGRPHGRPPGGGSNASHDWAKMAEMWAAKRRQPEPRRTPIQRSPDEPRGDATPLFDER